MEHLELKNLHLIIGAEFVLDKYHLASLLYKCFPHDRKNRGKIKSKVKQAVRELNKIIYDKCSVFIAKGDSKGLIDYLKTIYNTNVVPNKQDKLKN